MTSYTNKSVLLNLYLLSTMLLFASCRKENTVFENPYSGGKQALGVVFNNANPPFPAEGTAGAAITFNAQGLLNFKSQLIFSFNGQIGEVVNLTTSEITVKVPEGASSGSTSITIGDQVFFGPQFKVLGKINIDPYFKAINGANGSVNSYLKLNDGRLILVGQFTSYDGKGLVIPNNRIVLTTKEGEIDRSFRFGTAANGSVLAIAAPASQSNFYIGGNFAQFDKLNRFVNNIARLLPTGAIDTTVTVTYSGKRLGIPIFNGGTNGPVNKLFYDQNKIIAVGSFTHHVTRKYNQGRTFKDLLGNTVLKDTIITDSLQAKQIIRFNPDGSIDKTYHFNIAENKGLTGGNGAITDAYMQADGKLVLVGTFSKFDDVEAGHIVRLNTNGTIDNTFNGGKAGANSNVSSITFNPLTNKYLLAGIFGSYNGEQVQGLVQLNLDGSIDNSFVTRDFDNGFPAYAKQLSNGVIVVSGTFKKYNGTKRPGFMMLSANGNLAPGYNGTGDFTGALNNVYELQNQDNKRALILMGNFNKFDNRIVSNITGIALDN